MDGRWWHMLSSSPATTVLCVCVYLFYVAPAENEHTSFHLESITLCGGINRTCCPVQQ